MKKVNLTSIIISLILLVWSNVNAVSLRTPKWLIYGDYKVERDQVDGSRSIFNIISFVNEYLWFAIWFFCFLFMIRNGYQLIMARGDEKQTKSATSALIWCVIWITICLLAYIIVNIAINLFA